MSELVTKIALLAELRAEMTHTLEAGRRVPPRAIWLESDIANHIAAIDAGAGVAGYSSGASSVDLDEPLEPELRQWRQQLDQVIDEMQSRWPREL